MSDRQLDKANFSIVPKPDKVLSVKWSSRWEIFRRLKALQINCQCRTNEPLLIDLHSPTTLVQIWSVIRQSSATRTQLIDWLDNCWSMPYDRYSKNKYFDHNE